MKTLTLKKIMVGMVLVMVVSLFAVPAVVSAQGSPANSNFGLENVNFGISRNDDLKGTINSIIQVLLGFLGILAVIIILWGGFIWMTAAGDETKVDKAKKLIVSGIIGIVIILAAYAIASFVIININSAIDGT